METLETATLEITGTVQQAIQTIDILRKIVAAQEQQIKLLTKQVELLSK